jgi:hypothetical protein
MADMLMFFGAMIFFLCFPIVIIVGGAMLCDKATRSHNSQKVKVVRVRGFYGTCLGYACSHCDCGQTGNFGTSVQINYKQYEKCPRCGILLDWDNIVEEKRKK